MTFDDGYDDARRYIQSRAARHPKVQWRFMVCPHKISHRHGFAWDRWVQEDKERDPEVFIEEWERSCRRDDEHSERSRGAAEASDYRLSTADECRAVAALPNVELGNHTDHHIPTAWLSDADLDAELETSERRFADLFGPAAHFAFPFGTELYVKDRDIERAQQKTAAEIWTVDISPYPADARGPGAVKPRFAWTSDGYPPKAQALYMALKCAAYRTRS